jgi:predicted TPR repeat methyltransferase
MDRCPNCQARVDDAADTCRRCGMGLGLMRAAERAAEHWLRRGIADLAAGEPDAAARALGRSLALRRDPLAEQLLGQLRPLRPRLALQGLGVRDDA